MPLRGVSCTGIGDQRHQVAEITCITHRRTDALISEQPADDQKVNTEVAQNIVNVGRNEDTRRGLRKYDFIFYGSDFTEDLSIP